MVDEPGRRENEVLPVPLQVYEALPGKRQTALPALGGTLVNASCYL